MSNYSRIQKFDAQIRRLKSTDHNADVTAILKAALQDTEDLDEKLYVLSRLVSEYQMLGKLDDAEDAVQKQITLNTSNPEAWLQLATHYYRYSRDLSKALSTVEIAIEKATQEGNFVRQTHTERIRIALEMKNYQTVEDSLARLIIYTPKPGSIDVELESDFLPRIPAGVAKELVEKYTKLTRRNG